MPYRVAVVVSGRGSNLVALCDAIVADPDVAVVLVASDRSAPALLLAEHRGIATHRFESHQDPAEWCDLLARYSVDLVVLAGFLKMVPSEVVTRYAGRIINIHPALLPRHGGAGMYGSRVHAAVVASGDAVSGATVHLVDEVYDRGAVLGQATVSVQSGDTAADVAERVLMLEHRLLPAAVRAAARAGKPVPFDFS